jgi:phosphatidate cytidylyltransferase
VAGIDPALRPPNGETRPRRLGNLAVRILSALILAPVAVAAAYYGGWPFAVLWTLAAVAVLWEWTALVAPGRSRMAFSVGTVALVVAALMGELDRPITASLLVLLGAVAVAIFSSDVRRAWVCSGVVYAGVLLLAPIEPVAPRMVTLRGRDAVRFCARVSGTEVMPSP